MMIQTKMNIYFESKRFWVHSYLSEQHSIFISEKKNHKNTTDAVYVTWWCLFNFISAAAHSVLS